jgi:hypothetical protein
LVQDADRVAADNAPAILNHVRFESGSSRGVGEAARMPI